MIDSHGLHCSSLVLKLFYIWDCLLRLFVQPLEWNRKCVCDFVCVCVCVCTVVSVCVYVCVRMWVTYTHTHTHTIITIIIHTPYNNSDALIMCVDLIFTVCVYTVCTVKCNRSHAANDRKAHIWVKVPFSFPSTLSNQFTLLEAETFNQHYYTVKSVCKGFITTPCRPL